MAASRPVETAAPLIPGRLNLPGLRQAAAHCQACPLWKAGTQTVFGEGADDAKIVLVGEVPGDREDIEGKFFVGPAGTLLNHALEETGIDRQQAYVTNAVKHFKWSRRANATCTRSPTPVRSPPAARGWKQNWLFCAPTSSSPSAQSPPRLWGKGFSRHPGTREAARNRPGRKIHGDGSPVCHPSCRRGEAPD